MTTEPEQQLRNLHAWCHSVMLRRERGRYWCSARWGSFAHGSHLARTARGAIAGVYLQRMGLAAVHTVLTETVSREEA